MDNLQPNKLNLLQKKLEPGRILKFLCMGIMGVYIVAAAWGWITHGFFYKTLPLQAFFIMLIMGLGLYIQSFQNAIIRRKIALLMARDQDELGPMPPPPAV